MHMQSYLNDPSLKANLLRHIRAHERADMIRSGVYGELDSQGKFHGCAVGCALHSLNQIKRVGGNPLTDVGEHARFPADLGIPIELAYFIDNIFENLPAPEQKTWPYRVMSAVPVGVDLSGVIPTLSKWMILDEKNGLIALADTPDNQATLREFAVLVAKEWAGDSQTTATWIGLNHKLSGVAWWKPYWGAWAGAWMWVGAWMTTSSRRTKAEAYETLSARLIQQLKATAPKTRKSI